LNQGHRIYDELIAPVEERMKRTVARIVRNPEDAADAFQNALASIWKNLRKIHRHPNPQACILGICINASYDTLRKRSRIGQREVGVEGLSDFSSPQEGPDSRAIGCEQERAILTAVCSLPPKQATAVFLRLVEGESFQAIAEAIGCREATARSHVSKGKAGLRELLADVL
jgi:RNA polymerase sigma-70 factor (ECF subfamily)